jgi:hypothetical protein
MYSPPASLLPLYIYMAVRRCDAFLRYESKCKFGDYEAREQLGILAKIPELG